MHQLPESVIDRPTILVVFGITGDLSTKKIIPSLWHLFVHKRLPKKLSVIGIARRELSQSDFQNNIRKILDQKYDLPIDNSDFQKFCEYLSYENGDVREKDIFENLRKNIDATEKSWGVCTNKLFYFSVKPESYEDIMKGLAGVELNLPCGGDLGWSRILVEKPFGLDLESSKTLNKNLSNYFKEEQIYRIDHYLFKEIIQGIENFRFSNNLFEKTWDRNSIERIDIRVCESIDVKDRGEFYDSVGALRDVGQNHLLMMLSAITMEASPKMTTDAIRKERLKILKSLKSWNKKDLKENTYRAQYKGYLDINGVSKDSNTETYFALKTELKNKRWKGVPIYMEAGKALGESRKEIVLTLKNPEDCLLCEVDKRKANQVIFRLEPNDEIVIHFWAKKPGFEKILEERTLSFFLYEKETKVQYVEEYSKVLYSSMVGEQELFISSDEVEALWKFSDPINIFWNQGLVDLENYPYGNKPCPKIIDSDLICDFEMKDKGQVGLIGLGKMGKGIARQLKEDGFEVVINNRSKESIDEMKQEGFVPAYEISELVSKLELPRKIWLMVPHSAVDGVLDELVPKLNEGDLIIEGGNSFYKESVKRGKELSQKGIKFLDAGVSGGPGGARNGACVMIGGDRKVFEENEEIFKSISLPGGYSYMGDVGAGHFVKMVHNGIEYGMMQAIGEGFEVLKKSEYDLDLYDVTKIYSTGSVIESRLVSWLKDAYRKFGPDLDKEECCSATVSHSGEGQWTVDTAKEFNIPVKIIEESLQFRKDSKDNPSYTGRVVSALRHEFGGHDTSDRIQEN